MLPTALKKKRPELSEVFEELKDLVHRQGQLIQNVVTGNNDFCAEILEREFGNKTVMRVVPSRRVMQRLVRRCTTLEESF